MMLCLAHLQANNSSSNATPHANTLAYTLATHTHSSHATHTHSQLIYTHATHTLAHAPHTQPHLPDSHAHTRDCPTRNTTQPPPLTKKN